MSQAIGGPTAEVPAATEPKTALVTYRRRAEPGVVAGRRRAEAALVRRRRRGVSRLLVLAAGLLLVACTPDGGAVSPEPTPSLTEAQTTPATETPSPEPTTDSTTEPAPGPTPWPEPTRPAAMERDDIEGAIAAAEYFLALYPYVYATGDLVTWQEMSHPECQFCQSTVDNVTQIHEGGGFTVSGDFVVDDVGASPPDDEFEHYRVGLYGTESPWATYNSSGDILSSTEGGRGSYHFGILRSGGAWEVRGVFAESES